ALFDFLAGEPLFDPARRELPRSVLALRRGPTTAFRARRRDGQVVERTLGDPERSPSVVEATMSGALIVDEAAIVDEASASGSVDDGWDIATDPTGERAATPTAAIVDPPPPWWALWRWVARWFRAWRARKHLEIP